MGDQTQAYEIFQTPLSSGYPLPLRIEIDWFLLSVGANKQIVLISQSNIDLSLPRENIMICDFLTADSIGLVLLSYSFFVQI